MKRGLWVASMGGGLIAGVVGFGLGYAAHPDTVSHVVPRSAEEWSAAAAWVAVLLASVGAVIAYQQAAEARRLRIEQAQPYVVAYLEQLPSSPMIIELVIKNLGVTAARNVRIAVDRPLRRTAILGQPGTIEDVWLPDEPIFLAPGQDWRTTWDFSRDRLASEELKDEDRHVMTLTYDGVERTGLQENVSVLDWGPFKGRIYTEVKTSHHAAKALHEISRSMVRWTERGKLSVIQRSAGALPERRLPGRLTSSQPQGATGQMDAGESPNADDDAVDMTGDAAPRPEGTS